MLVVRHIHGHLTVSRISEAIQDLTVDAGS